eukprot:CAMPEP_0202959536 /NCGR_PEP_ID=MMETSP1396-20130829/3713_1 /ASSEMBLY_ACC=CAM_ASM_000872 /TAXON_ID= /ORGANISM="Pseudokeronopsis sp., Strain Brazil" /LENGTH=168 /DNA_ID=CAMNT_0049678131 /DNA_START=238 /DNA_END=740 /DNA_ORIENTATION=+
MSCCARLFTYQGNRGYKAVFKSPWGKRYIFSQEYTCLSFFDECFQKSTFVYDEDQRLLGEINKIASERNVRVLRHGVQILKGSEKKVLMKILYAYCCFGCGNCSTEFDVTDEDLQNIEGPVYIKKESLGCFTECFAQRDKYNFSLPADEDDAALVVGAIHAMDMKYFG